MLPPRPSPTGSPDWDELFLSAALEPAQWPQALQAMADATGSSHGQLIGMGADRTMPFNLVTGFTEHHIMRSLEAGAASPETNYRIAANEFHIARGAYDPVLHEADYDAVMPLLASRSYVDFCAEIDILHGCQTNLVIDNGGVIGLATLRSRQDGRSRPAQRRMFARAAQSARRAVRLQERLENDSARLLAGAFEAMSTTAFILDGAGQVQAMTSGAELLIQRGQIALNRGRLDARGSPFDLARAVAKLTIPGGLPHLRLRVEAPHASTACFLEGFRLPVRQVSFGRLPHAILVQRQPGRDKAGIAEYLGVLYKLSPAEADIAIRLYEGQDRAQIAAGREVAPDTLRGQIKALLGKAGCINEAALMRLLGSIVS